MKPIDSGTPQTPGPQGAATPGAAPANGGGTLASTSGSGGSRSAAQRTAAANRPIELGFVRTGVSNAAAFGASIGNTITEADVDAALVAAFNDGGGIAGHPIVPVYADTDTGSASWDADYAAACAKFTQDHHVAAVLGYVFAHEPAFESCLSQKGVPHLSTTTAVPDTAELVKYPLLFALSTPRMERRSIEKIDGGLATGILTKTSRLGIMTDSCPGTQKAWTGTTRPYIEAKGLTIASVFELGCAHGAGDVSTEAGQAGNLILQFRTAGVDRVLFMAVSEGPPTFVVANAAEAQGWHPLYVLSSLAGTAVLAGQIPPDQAANVHEYGWLPMLDVNPPQWPPTNATQQRCISMLKKKGINPSSAADYSYAFNVCDAMFVYEAALKATAGSTDGPSVVAAVEALGSSYVSAMMLDGRSKFTHSQHDAPYLARYVAWDGGCSCFTYRQTLVPIT